MSQRDAMIVAARQRGDTLQEIGSRFGISRERVRRILLAAGAADSETSKGARAQREIAAAELRRDEVIAAWRAGLALGEISARLALRRACVMRLIDAHATAADKAVRRVALYEAARRARPRGYSDEELIAAVRQVVKDAGRVPTCKEYGELARASGLPSLSTVENRFGGWHSVLRAARITPTRAPRGRYACRWTEESCLAAVSALVAELGEFPSICRYDELSPERPDLPCSATLRNRVGSWSQLAARVGVDISRQSDKGAHGRTH